MNDNEQMLLVAAFYKFIALENYAAFKQPLLDCCRQYALNGTILLAAEGINGTVAGSEEGIAGLFSCLRAKPEFKDLGYKGSFVASAPFHRMKVKLKKEIVSMGQAGIDPGSQTGVHVPPSQWNTLISAADVFVLDTRNHYESAIGSFTHAHSPKTTNFREFPDYVAREMAPEKMPKVAMFCTGGIRCEKASAWLLEQGFKEVYQLEGGILNYMEKVPPEDSLWQGECFVFDHRVAVDHALEEGSYRQCFACRRPLSADDLQADNYIEGVSCSHCYADLTAERRQGFAERQRQVRLAESRHEKHIGARMSGVSKKD